MYRHLFRALAGPKRPRPKRPINFRYDENGPQLRPKQPTTKTGFRSLATLSLVVDVVGEL